MFNPAYGLPVGNGAFLGEGVPTGIPASDTAFLKAGGTFDPAFALGADGLVGTPTKVTTPTGGGGGGGGGGVPTTTTTVPTTVPTTTTTVPTNLSSVLTPAVVKGITGLLSTTVLAKGLTPTTNTQMPMGALPTQGVPLNSADYFKAIQANYNQLLPLSNKDVASPLAAWYNSQYGA